LFDEFIHKTKSTHHKGEPSSHHHESPPSPPSTNKKHMELLEILLNRYETEKDVALKDKTKIELKRLAEKVADDNDSKSLKNYLKQARNHQSQAIIKKLKAILHK
jgi:hypothetical protein